MMATPFSLRFCPLLPPSVPAVLNGVPASRSLAPDHPAAFADDDDDDDGDDLDDEDDGDLDDEDESDDFNDDPDDEDDEDDDTTFVTTEPGPPWVH
jgi:hypothetical protein